MDELGKEIHQTLVVTSINKSWRPGTQRRDCSQQSYITNFEVAKRLDLNCEHHNKRNDNYVM